MTRLTTTPAYCCGCFQQNGELRHVDFESAWDGPTIPGQPSPVPIDDLILCERCLAEAFAILDPQDLKQTIAELEQVVRDMAEEIRAKDKAIKGAKFTIQELEPLVVHSKIPGKPGLIGVQDDVRKILTQRQYERGPTSPKSDPKRYKKQRKESGSPTPEIGTKSVENATVPQPEEVSA